MGQGPGDRVVTCQKSIMTGTSPNRRNAGSSGPANLLTTTASPTLSAISNEGGGQAPTTRSGLTITGRTWSQGTIAWSHFWRGWQRYTTSACPDGGWEDGFEKIALYGLNEAAVRHAALQVQDGLWRSKLGPGEDIELTLEGLAGPLYGRVIAYLKRPRAVEQTVSQPPVSEPEAR